MLHTIDKRKKGGTAFHIIISVAVVAAIFALLIFFPWGNEEKRDIKQLPEDLPSNDLSGKFNDEFNDKFDDKAIMDPDLVDPNDLMLRAYINDTTYLSPDTAQSFSPEERKRQKEMMMHAAEKFRAKYKEKAQTILKEVYTSENMNDRDKYMNAYNNAVTRLANIQEELTELYRLDPSTTQRIAAQVFDEVADNAKKKVVVEPKPEPVMNEAERQLRDSIAELF